MTEQLIPSITEISAFFGLSITQIITVTTASTEIDRIFILKTEKLFYCVEQSADLRYYQRQHNYKSGKRGQHCLLLSTASYEKLGKNRNNYADSGNFENEFNIHYNL